MHGMGLERGVDRRGKLKGKEEGEEGRGGIKTKRQNEKQGGEREQESKQMVGRRRRVRVERVHESMRASKLENM
eukprot:6195164-Pleurochrysis_carterae.AAC.1